MTIFNCYVCLPEGNDTGNDHHIYYSISFCIMVMVFFFGMMIAIMGF